MGINIFGRKIGKVGVIGSGQIGPDLALFFSQSLFPYGVSVVVVDVSQAALDAGLLRVQSKIDKGVTRGKVTKEGAEAMLRNIKFTTDYGQLSGADFVVEAATEDLSIKRRIFAQLEATCPETAILASNSSHMEPEVIFDGLRHKGRTVVNHYFFPAERNMLVEVVPGRDTEPGLAESLLKFYEEMGKAPILVRSRYSYAVDPIFEGIMQAACICVEEGIASTKVVDAIATKSLGMAVGPFTAHNLAGGSYITQHGLNEMHHKIMPWFRSPKILDDQVASGQPWEVAARGVVVEYDDGTFEKVDRALKGAYFGLAGEVLECGITSLEDLEMALEVGLVMRPPFGMMNELGVDTALELVRAYARSQPGFPIPKLLEERARSGRPWEIPLVLRQDIEDVAVVKIRRPRYLNALNEMVFQQLEAHFRAIGEDPKIKGAVLTGFGNRAFVSGADLAMLAAIKTPEDGEATSLKSQAVLNLIEELGKPVVCAMNGLAFGGGNELALACSARIARKGIAAFISQPEVNLGFIAGAGGTQRLPRLVGVERASTLLRTGRSISSAEALEMGIIREEVEGDLVQAAIGLVRRAAAGTVTLPSIPRGPIPVPRELPGVELGHLSRAIDPILQRAILEGARMSLSEGLKFEAKMFAECCKTEDMRIGIENFIKNGPRVKAEFKGA